MINIFIDNFFLYGVGEKINNFNIFIIGKWNIMLLIKNFGW